MHQKRASSACGKLRFAAQRPRAGGMSKDILPFPLSTCPTAAETSLSLEVGRAQFGQAEEEEAMVKQLLGYGQHLSVFTLCWIQALSTVLCHGQFICGVALARLFVCDEIKKNASHESRYGGTDCEDYDLCISRNLAKQIIMTVCLILDEVTRGPPSQHSCMSWWSLFWISVPRSLGTSGVLLAAIRRTSRSSEQFHRCQ